MTAVAPVALSPQDHHARSRNSRRFSGTVRRPPPLAPSPIHRTLAAVYRLSAIDRNGRVADSGAVKVMGWHSDTRLTICAENGAILLRADRDGRSRVMAQGRIHLPVAVRRTAGLLAGDHALLCADPGEEVLRIYPLAALDAMITAHLRSLGGGDPA